MTRARDLADSADKDIVGTLTLDGLVVDDITIDGSTISDGGDFTLDVGGDITLDADGADIRLKDGGTEFAILHNSGYFGVYSTISDADLKIQGNDGGSLIDALTFDMSQAGRAIFNEGVVCKSSTGGDFGVNINTASGDSMKLQVVDTGSAGAANGVISVSDGDLILSPSANVGIGESSPLSNLHIEDTSGAVLTLGNSQDPNDVVAGTVFGRINFYASDRSGATNATGGVARIEAIASSGYSSSTPSDLLFYTHGASANDGSVLGNPSERLRIDSSGRLLHGKTSTAFSVAGHRLDADGNVEHIRDGNPPLNLNRKSSDGDIAVFYKDGSAVGSIGTKDGRLLIEGSQGSTPAGIYFGGGGDVLPATSGNVSDNNISLGGSSYRFKDLYLSGGVYLGGTGSANKLEDYEEGTFTPTFGAVAAPTYSAQQGKYTKIGNVVHCTVSIDVSTGLDTSDASGVSITSLPFAALPNEEVTNAALGRYINLLGSKATSVTNFRQTSSSVILYQGHDSAITYNQINSGGFLQIAFTYRTS